MIYSVTGLKNLVTNNTKKRLGHRVPQRFKLKFHRVFIFFCVTFFPLSVSQCKKKSMIMQISTD